MSFSLRMTISYSIFLLLCLGLALGLYRNAGQNARDHFWEERHNQISRYAETFVHYQSVMDSYSRQLLTDSTFVRLSNMNGIEDQGFIYTAYEVMQKFSDRMYALSDMPVSLTNVFMFKSGYVISASQFTEVRDYYDNYRVLMPGYFDEWQQELLSTGANGRCIDAAKYTGVEGTYFYVRNVDAILNRSVPAVIIYELSMSHVRDLFLVDDLGADPLVVVLNDKGERQMVLHRGDVIPFAPALLENATYNEGGFCDHGDLRFLRVTASNGWVYLVGVESSLCDDALGNNDLAILLVSLFALLAGGVLVTMLVRHNMRPIHQLSTQLEQAEGEKAELEMEMESQRPMLQASYLRKLLSGHVPSNEEFDYMIRYLGMESSHCFYVLHVIAHRQDGAPSDANAEVELISDCLRKHLSGEYPVQFYTTLDRSFIVLVAYGDSVSDPLMDLQRRVVELHNTLLNEHSLWLYAGVGERRTQPQNLWESYEQSREAARYTAKNHIFLPYEVMSKDTQSFYYPVEFSAKLQHFITTGNKQQVVEMFALLRHENLEARSLPISLLNFLLSDLKNTLLKARFQAIAQTEDEQAKLTEIDERLYSQVNFPLLESTALLICDFFTRAAEPSDPIPDVERYLTENFTDPSMCLTKLSDLFHISESYLSHLFKDRTGQNFSVYLENLRLNEAANRLRSKDCNLSVLYSELGYNNPTTFRRAFKKRYGLTPSEMRERN